MQQVLGMMAFWSAGGILVAGTIGLCFREVQLFRRGESIVSKRQLVFRMVGGVITLALVGKVMVGVLFVRGDAPPSTFLFYWLECAGLASLAVFVALVDYCSVRSFRRRCQRDLSSRVGRLYATVMHEADAARKKEAVSKQ
jgi:hypothetical protein